MTTTIDQTKTSENLLNLEELKPLPDSLCYVRVGDNKGPYENGWQNKQIKLSQVCNGDNKLKAIGVNLGEISGGTIAVDFDALDDSGALNELLTTHIPGFVLPSTVTVTSGKPGRRSYLYHIPEEHWPELKNIAYLYSGNAIWSDDGKPEKIEQIEFRWNGHQQIIMGSHPETNGYRWIVSPTEAEIAQAPEWMINVLKGKYQALAEEFKPKPKQEAPRPPKAREKPKGFDSNSQKMMNAERDRRLALEILEQLPTTEAGTGTYPDYREVSCALKNIFGEDEAIRLMDQHSPNRPWKQIIPSSTGDFGMGTLVHHAKYYVPGWDYPDWWKKSFPKGQKPTDYEADTNDRPLQAVSTLKQSNNLQKTTVKRELKALLEKEVSGSDLQGQLNELAKKFKWSKRDLQENYDLLKAEAEKEDERDDNQRELEQIVAASNQSINLKSILVSEIADPLLAFAKYINARPEVLLTALLCGISAVHKKESKVKVNNNWEVFLNLFAMLIALSSQCKSPINRAMIGKPINDLQWQADQEYENKLSQYKKDSQEYQSLKKEQRMEAFPDGEPEPPRRRAYLTTDSTMEGLFAQAQAQEHGQLVHCDELAGLFSGLNQYKGGGGNDGQRLIEAYDSDRLHITRKKEGTISVKASLGVYGGIQPQVLADLLNKSSGDANGTFARFLMVEQPFAKMRLNPDGGDIDISSVLTPIYQAIDWQPATTYTLEHQAYVALCLANDRWEDARGENIQHPISNVYGKARGRTVKLAVNIHCINYAAQGLNIPSVISSETMEAAIALTDFYNAQGVSLYARLMGDTPNLPAKLSKIISLAQGREDRTVTARDVSNRARITKNSQEAIDLFKELEKMGYGALAKHLKSYKFVASSGIDTRIDTKNAIDAPIDTELTQGLAAENTSHTNGFGGSHSSIDTIDTKVGVPNSMLLLPNPEPTDTINSHAEPPLEVANSHTIYTRIDTKNAIDAQIDTELTQGVTTENTSHTNGFGKSHSSIDTIDTKVGVPNSMLLLPNPEPTDTINGHTETPLEKVISMGIDTPTVSIEKNGEQQELETYLEEQTIDVNIPPSLTKDKSGQALQIGDRVRCNTHDWTIEEICPRNGNPLGSLLILKGVHSNSPIKVGSKLCEILDERG